MTQRISKTFNRPDWLVLRENLRNKSLLDDHWAQAIKLIRDRVSERYLKPLQILINHEKSYLGAGFTIATIECALIEFLAAFSEGKIFWKDKPSTGAHYYYDDSARLYSRFLRTSEIFAPYFGGTPPTYRPDDFYKNVRCALIHEAQTKKGWEIRIYDSTREKDFSNKILIETDKNDTKFLYRTAMFFALRDFFENYCDQKLKEPSNRGQTRRKYLARKIDAILEIQPDKKFWW